MEEKQVATLKPVRLEVARGRGRRLTYAWVDGYQVIQPNGKPLFPYMRRREAIAHCKSEGWAYQVSKD